MKNLFIILAFPMIFTGCKSKPDLVESTLVPNDIFVRYSDSTYAVAIDTVALNMLDTAAMKQLSGYYRIVIQDGSFLEEGQLLSGGRDGVWRSYHFWGVIPRQILWKIATYHAGKLNGKYFSFTDDGVLIEAFCYLDNKQVGKQKEYDDESRRPVLIYETNEDEQFINDYLAISDKGDTLYHTNFGQDATGYVKRYDRWGVILSEGMMIRGKQKAVTYYEYDYYHERYISARHYMVTDTSADLQWIRNYPEK